MADPPAPAPVNAPPTPVPAKAPPSPAPSTDSGVPASQFGLLENGDFFAKLGPVGFKIAAADLSAKGIDFSERPQPIPGLRIQKISYRDKKVSLTAGLSIPNIADGNFEIKVGTDGKASFKGEVERTIAIPALGNPKLKAGLAEDGTVTGSATVTGVNLLPKSLKAAEAKGSGSIAVTNGQITGGGTIDLAYASLGAATVNFKFGDGGAFSADGSIRITPPFVNEITGKLAVDENRNLSATVTVDAASQTSPVPALTLAAGSITVSYLNGQPGATLTNFGAEYKGLGSISIATATLDRSNKIAGAGTFALTVPMLEKASGTVALKNGNVSGSLTITADKFPKGLPVKKGSITATLSEQGKVAFAGSVGVDFGLAGSGQLEGSYSEAGELTIGAEADLKVPGLQQVHVVLAYREGQIEGEIGVPVNPEILPGLTGNVIVRYKEGLWSGETTLSYSADNGKLSGTVTVTVAQTPEGTLQLGGSGSVTAQIMPKLSGTLTATILPEGGVDVSGAIVVTEPLELFPEKRVDKELFKYSQNIPLWAILVAIIRVRAGIRAGIGPGVFRNIKVEGSYTIGADKADPSFTISGEMFIPAFVEGYVAFGAGLGLDVLLGSLTGGIEGVATAGIYGAISVVPELSYADGDWGIEGTATLAAGARLKLGLNAWAEIEALWVTVWDQEWKLAEYVMPIGPDMALQAHMAYKFGQPLPPEIELKTSDIDTGALISEAMPKDGPAGSGAREALENKAAWKGALKEQRKAPVPPETAAQAKTAETPPAPPPKPGKKPGPPAGGAKAKGEGSNKDPGAVPTPGNQPARSAAVDAAAKPDTSVKGSVPESAIPNANTPRYPGPITLALLDEPPAPMPRTRAQEQEDVEAAKKAVDLASGVASDSDALDNYFPRIKARFGLSSLGYEGNFETGFEVVGQINPAFKVTEVEPLTGTGIPGDLQAGHITAVEMQGAELGGDQVGVKMTAMPLGPDHPAGSGPSGQDSLMGMLPTDPKVYGDADTRFIRGHLLNDNLGGPGTANNLFPITAHANSVHHAVIESSVKKWVNDKKYWVRYSVAISGDNTLSPASASLKFINSTITAKASVLNTKLNPVSGLTREVTIESKYKKPATSNVTKDVDEDKLDKHTARDIDKNVAVQLSDRHTDTVTFPGPIEQAIANSYARGNTREKIKGAMMGYVGFGEARAELIMKIYVAVCRRSDKTVTNIDFDGSGAKRDPNAAEKAALTFVAGAWASNITQDLDKKL
ncbi:MAG: hypothetical protein ACOH2J_10530 [Allorhizobium sp.]